jgi:hypothetical protein
VPNDYSISKCVYYELKAFCLDYPEKKRKLADLRNPLKCQTYSDMPHGSTTGNPTAAAAERAARLSKDCEVIEQTAIKALPDAYQQLIKNVTENILFKPCLYVNWATFRIGRRYFYYLLSLK